MWFSISYLKKYITVSIYSILYSFMNTLTVVEVISSVSQSGENIIADTASSKAQV